MEEPVEFEEAFMQGYNDEEEEKVCEECGVAIRDKKVVKKLNDEEKLFCSEECAIDYEETM